MAVPTEQLPWKMGISWVENETVVDEVPGPHGAELLPEAAVPEAAVPEALVPDVVPDPVVPVEPDSAFVPEPVPPPFEPPLPPVAGLVPQAMPVASEAIVPKERIIDVARRMKTVLSLES
jgi:hypothetical protein